MIQGALTALPEEVLLGPGFLFTRNTLFGVTRGGLTFAPQRAQRNVPFDGKMAPIQGLHWDTSVDPILSGAFLQYRFPTVPAREEAVSSTVFTEDWDYASKAARDLVWIKTSDQAGSYSYTFPAAGSDPAETVTGDNGGFDGSAGDLGDTINMHVGIIYGGGIGGGGGFGKHTLTLSDLTPGATYTVICDRVRLSRARSGFSDNCGLSVNGGTGVTPADGDGPVSVSGTANSSGELTIALGHYDLEFGTSGMAMIFGRITVEGESGTVTIPATSQVLYEPGSRGASGSGNVTTAYTMQQHAAAFSAGDYLEHLRWVFPWPEGGFVQIRFPLAFIRRYQVMTTRETEAAIHTVIEGVRSLDGAASDPGTVPWVIERLSAFS
jgi:hypothetical protein